MFKDLRSFIEQIGGKRASMNISFIGIPLMGIVPPIGFPPNDNTPPDNGDEEPDEDKD